jgi:hypothetical protein
MKAFEGNDHEEVWFGLEQEFTWVAKQDFVRSWLLLR